MLTDRLQKQTWVDFSSNTVDTDHKINYLFETRATLATGQLFKGGGVMYSLSKYVAKNTLQLSTQ